MNSFRVKTVDKEREKAVNQVRARWLKLRKYWAKKNKVTNLEIAMKSLGQYGQ